MEHAELPLTAGDERYLAGRGIAVAEALRQLELLRHPPRPAPIVRPCTPGDGIVQLPEAEAGRLLEVHQQAAAAGRVSLFVPASGAASRMFKELLALAARDDEFEPRAVRAAAAAGDGEAGVLAQFVDGLPRLALGEPLAAAVRAQGGDLAALRERGPWRPILTALLGADGLDAARRPKGLLPFHRGPDGPRTPFEEHLEESVGLARDAGGASRLHFTVSPEHRQEFAALLAGAGPREGARHGARYEVAFSEQQPSTETLAIEPGGRPFRGAGGELVLRPSGHGALLRNLQETGGDLVFVRNIDNVTPASGRGPSSRWSRVLIALAAELGAAAQALGARLANEADARAPQEALAFLLDSLGEAAPSTDRRSLAERLDRPLRVCGMVRNTGEPGGGPFWVRDADGAERPQIVESAQVRADEPGQRALFASATHFNPVFLAVALRDGRGRVHDLGKFIDPGAVLVARKSAGGRELLALERPGLWNGAMAGWLTVFVEVPAGVFNPVKSVLDLLRPAHQG